MSTARVRFYGDESGMHGSGACVVAGYLATAENWKLFDEDWKDALGEERSASSSEGELHTLATNRRSSGGPMKSFIARSIG